MEQLQQSLIPHRHAPVREIHSRSKSHATVRDHQHRRLIRQPLRCLPWPLARRRRTSAESHRFSDAPVQYVLVLVLSVSGAWPPECVGGKWQINAACILTIALAHLFQCLCFIHSEHAVPVLVSTSLQFLEQPVDQSTAAQFLRHADAACSLVSKVMPPPLINVVIHQKIAGDQNLPHWFLAWFFVAMVTHGKLSLMWMNQAPAFAATTIVT